MLKVETPALITEGTERHDPQWRDQIDDKKNGRVRYCLSSKVRALESRENMRVCVPTSIYTFKLVNLHTPDIHKLRYPLHIAYSHTYMMVNKRIREQERDVEYSVKHQKYRNSMMMQ
ncbi:hypothetical protein GOP47_0006859 [Adiantum capillus-veneris]|uniref:Uncharacterized protein n=1 Tax=Adiantum capillus-veneris TaxID=13818 RepID=A0A9D4V4P1_ADICA|nr:hypothetical protein GOP47_0006859 [Adiantum capillus-veneris]